MHEYMTRQMVALKPFTYADWPLEPGDKFMATPDDAGYLTRCLRAKPAAPQVGAQVPPTAAVAEVLPPAAEQVELDPQPAPVADLQPEPAPVDAKEAATAAAAPELRRRGRPTNAEKLSRQAAEAAGAEPQAASAS